MLEPLASEDIVELRVGRRGGNTWRTKRAGNIGEPNSPTEYRPSANEVGIQSLPPRPSQRVDIFLKKFKEQTLLTHVDKSNRPCLVLKLDGGGQQTTRTGAVVLPNRTIATTQPCVRENKIKKI